MPLRDATGWAYCAFYRLEGCVVIMAATNRTIFHFVVRENSCWADWVKHVPCVFVWGDTAFRSFWPAQECLLNLPAAGWTSVCGAHWLCLGDWPFRYITSAHCNHNFYFLCADLIIYLPSPPCLMLKQSVALCCVLYFVFMWFQPIKSKQQQFVTHVDLSFHLSFSLWSGLILSLFDLQRFPHQMPRMPTCTSWTWFNRQTLSFTCLTSSSTTSSCL